MKQERPVALQQPLARQSSEQADAANVANVANVGSGGAAAATAGFVPLRVPVPRRRHSEASVLQRTQSLPLGMSV